jgi:GalNAc5-diNAcBac-PP-undecaprenol beta-1,3-glucosyltransferase
MPFFSIVVPTYNRAHLIVPTIQSILAQEFPDFEILIIDDGSTDDTEDVVEIAFGHHLKINYIRKKNEERSIARNTGFELSRGQYVVFFDSDDLLLPHYLTVLYEAIEQHPQCNFFATKYQIDTGGVMYHGGTSFLSKGFYDYRVLLYGNGFGTMVCAKRHNPNFQFFPPQFNMCEDWIFNMQNLYKDKIYLIDNVAITIINHDDRSMMNNQKVIKGRLDAMNFIKNNINLSPKEAQILESSSYKACANHSYMDGKKIQAFHYWFKAIKIIGMDKGSLIIFFKIIIGRKIISQLLKRKFVFSRLKKLTNVKA